MSEKLVFMSHIHEEASLAFLIKEAIETEFSGFVDVFVSSDGTSIPAGSNFLKRIEDGLIGCIGAIFLISPTSVMRNWINFELGAVWIRSTMNIRRSNPEIPALPICHSGMTPSTLPAPLNNLNAIYANQASQLEFAFRSLQTAVGGKGMLKTDFNALSAKIIAFEQKYTLGANLIKLLSLINCDKRSLLNNCESAPDDINFIRVFCGFVETSIIQSLKRMESNELKGHIHVFVDFPGMTMTPAGGVSGAMDVKIDIDIPLVLRFKEQIFSNS